MPSPRARRSGRPLLWGQVCGEEHRRGRVEEAELTQVGDEHAAVADRASSAAVASTSAAMSRSPVNATMVMCAEPCLSEPRSSSPLQLAPDDVGLAVVLDAPARRELLDEHEAPAPDVSRVARRRAAA